MSEVEEVDPKTLKTEDERGTWTGKLDFLLSAIGYAVGLGNVWRFPYIAYQNGGASFLIPYVICLACCGLPLFFFELALGQFSSLGPISVWNAVPFFKGIGWAMVMISAFCTTYYNMIIAYTIYYIFASFTSELPWSRCKEEWLELFSDEWCLDVAENGTDVSNCTMKAKTPSECYWELEVLDISTGIDDDNTEFRWQLVLCLLLAWIVIFLCLCKGIKSSGKVVYVTATFPYIVLVMLLVRNVTLEGAMEGIKFHIVPDWSKLQDTSVWGAALVQIFYSLGVGFGGLETMASYNKFHNNVYRDALIVAILNRITSVFAGFVIFSVIGFMSVRMNLPIDQVVDAGPGLAFVAYPEGIAMMPIAPLWSVLFFMMLFTLGLDSQFAMMEAIITALVDEIKCLQGGRRKIWFTLALCIALFLVGLPQCTRAGIYVMSLFEWYGAGFSLMVVALLELVAICYVYGIQRFVDDIEMMVGHRPNYYWLVTWMVVSPIAMVLIIIFSIVYHSPVKYNDVEYPYYADWVGWGMVGSALGFIPLVALVELCKAGASGCLWTWRSLFNPTSRWRPAIAENRTGRYLEGRKNQEDGVAKGTTHWNKAFDPDQEI